MREKMYRFMQGRYGIDAFANFLMWTSVVLMVLNLFIGNFFLNTLVMAIIIYTYFRIFSRYYARRSAENRWYLTKSQGIRNWFYKIKNRMRTRKTHRVYSCPACKQKVRVPKGKGKIEISCPKCREKFVKRS